MGPDSDIRDKGQYPVVMVTWDDAVAFCKWASQTSGRKVGLPTEAQWERAARGSDARLYPWGNTPDPTRAGYENRAGGIMPVGKYSPGGDSPFGATDMAGNVRQWVSSLYKPYPYKADDGREDTFDRDPRVLRGGGFDDTRAHVRSAYRYHDWPKSTVGNFSFRVMVALAPSQ
jgi:formylglycine-generating enzyme required for sulfatase activity